MRGTRINEFSSNFFHTRQAQKRQFWRTAFDRSRQRAASPSDSAPCDSFLRTRCFTCSWPQTARLTDPEP
ncbi:uncharacterized protein STAUR_0555 [Stigmatella aurantiaca DW4/3-1]|uniref:Uncharacterized protein n=1 Tax=Stigmatella aurantiaca (strain DW4/3-1) TaxID=378806 RepID=E3FTE5_STIAD|nr:uncharacterized protein STAUR_0555 [Stigmatella aurantiaca DW4/3-1]